jgi:hypothetical protein
MTALSSGNLYQPKLVGTGLLQRMDDLMWPSYKRVTLEEGGDHYAEFQINAEDHDVNSADLERWFLNWIGCHFEETYGGQVVFAGYVHSLRIYVGGVMRQITLDDMYNRGYARYQSGSASSAAVTGAADDLDSQAIYGRKVIIHDTGIRLKDRDNQIDSKKDDIRTYIAAAHAAAIRNDVLAWHKLPRSSSGDLVTTDTSLVLEVYIQGYGHTVNWRTYNNASTSTTTTSTEIDTMLSTADYVTVGNIDTISTTVSVEADYEYRLDRIAALLEGENMKWGCFGGTEFTVTARDLTTIKYRRQAYGDRYGFLQGGRYVPEPLITPSGWLYTQDIFAGSGPDAADLRDDPRADWISTVEYSIDGITLTNPTWQRERVVVALDSALQETAKENPQPWIDRARLIQ